MEKNAARSVVAESAKAGLISGGGRMVDGAELKDAELAAGESIPPGDPGAEAAATAALSK